MITEELYQIVIKQFEDFCMYAPYTLEEYQHLTSSGGDEHLVNNNEDNFVDILNIINRLLKINVATFPNEVASLIKLIEDNLGFESLKRIITKG